MTQTTPIRAFPYPEGTDLLGEVDEHVRALAEALEAWNPKRRWRCSANTVANAIAPNAITGWPAVPLAAGKSYEIRGNIWYTSAAATTGPRPVLIASNGLTAAELHLTGTNQLTTTTVEKFRSTALAAALPFTAAVAAGTLLDLEAALKVGVAGSLQLQMGSEVAASAITVLAGSWWSIEEVTGA